MIKSIKHAWHWGIVFLRGVAAKVLDESDWLSDWLSDWFILLIAWLFDCVWLIDWFIDCKEAMTDQIVS